MDIKKVHIDMTKPMVRRQALIEGTIKNLFAEHQEADKSFALRVDAIKMQTDEIQTTMQKVLHNTNELSKQVEYLKELTVAKTSLTGVQKQSIWTDSNRKMNTYFSNENFKRPCLKCGKSGYMACNCYVQKYAKQHQWVPIAAQKIKSKQCKSQRKQGLQVDSPNSPSADAPETLWCTYCNERGHLIDECRTLRDQLFPWNRTSKRQVKENKSFARQLRFHKSKGDTQPQDLFEGSEYDLVYENRVLPSIDHDEEPVSDVTEVGPTSSDEKISDIHYHTNVEIQQFKGYAYAVQNSGTHTTFIVDSGASQHLITNECYFDPTTINRSVRTNLQTAAGSFTLKEKGTAHIHVQGTNGPFTLTLENAWLHREGSHSLISVSQLDSKLGLLTNFGANVITDQSGNSVIELIKREGVYVLPEALACATVTSSLSQPVAARSSMRISIPSKRMQEARVAHALSRSTARTRTAPRMTQTPSTAAPLPARASVAARRLLQPEATRRLMPRPLQQPIPVLSAPRRLPTPRYDDHDDAMLEHGLFLGLMDKVLGVGHNQARIVDLFSGVQSHVNNANANRFYSLIDNAFHHKWIDIDGWANCPYNDPKVITTTLSKGLADWQSSPSNTSLTVMIPVWEKAEWMTSPALSMYQCVHEYPEGSHIFEYPPAVVGGARTPAGPTKWPVRVYHLACATHTVTDIGQDVLLHARLGHPNHSIIPALLKSGVNLGITLGPMAGKSANAVSAQCGICRITKATRPPGQSKATNREKHHNFGDLAYMDIMGQFTKTPEGHQYALVLEDDATGYKAVGTMCLKSDAHEVFGELLEAFKNAKAKVRQPNLGGVTNTSNGIEQLVAVNQTCHTNKDLNEIAIGPPIIRTLQSDNAPELTAGRLAEKCRELGISQRKSNAYRHQNEAIIERTNRSIQDKGRAMLHQSALPSMYWAHAFRFSVYLLNRLPTSSSGRLSGKSPYQMLYNTVPDLSKLRTFGCKAYRWNDYDQRTENQTEEQTPEIGNYKVRRRRKLYDRATELTVIGMDDISPTYLLVNQKDPKKIIRSGMLSFDESNVMAHGKTINSGSVIVNAQSDFDMEMPDEEMLDKQLSFPFIITEHRVFYSKQDNEIYAIVKVNHSLYPRGVWTTVALLTEDSQENTKVLVDYLYEFHESDNINAYYPIYSLAELDESEMDRETTRQKRRSTVEPTKCVTIGIDCKEDRSDEGPKISVTVLTLDKGAAIIDVPAELVSIHGRALSHTLEGHMAHVDTDKPTMLAMMSAKHGEQHPSNVHRHVKLPINELDEYYEAHKATNHQVCSEPKTLAQARKQPDWIKWKEAINTEITGLQKTGTFVPVKHLPKGKVAIQTALKFKLKKLKTGEIDKYKARLVAHGQLQQYGVNYTEVFAPASQITTVTLLLILAVSMNLKVWHMDVYMAFLNSPLEEEIYIVFPDNCGAPCKIARLHKALYGLKQAAAEWAKLSHKKIMGIKGMRQSPIDPSFYYLIEGSLIVLLLVHVDDYMAATNQDTWWPWFIKYFNESYECKDLGILSQVVGVGVEFGDGFATLTREKPIQDNLKEYGLVDANAVLYPMQSKFSLPKGTGQMEGVPYLNLIGTLRYHERTTRPDICFALARMSKYCSAYDLSHYDALKRILRYLKGTIEKPLLITRNPFKVPGKICFSMYSDATWAEASSETLGYTIGWHIRCNGNPLFSKSKIIDRASLSSTQSEVVALSEGCKDLLMFYNLIEDFLEVETPMTVYVDNTATIHLVNHPVFNNSSKYIGSRSFWTRDLVTDGIIELRYIKTSDNIADYLTKPLSGARFTLFRDILMGHRPTDPEPEEIGQPKLKPSCNQSP